MRNRPIREDRPIFRLWEGFYSISLTALSIRLRLESINFMMK